MSSDAIMNKSSSIAGMHMWRDTSSDRNTPLERTDLMELVIYVQHQYVIFIFVVMVRTIRSTRQYQQTKNPCVNTSPGVGSEPGLNVGSSFRAHQVIEAPGSLVRVCAQVYAGVGDLRSCLIVVSLSSRRLPTLSYT